MPIAWIVLFGVQWIAIMTLAVVVLGLNRRLIAPLSAPDATLGLNMLDGLPPIGAVVPSGAELLSPIEPRSRTAVLFLGSGCPPCRELADQLAQVQSEGNSVLLAADAELVVVTDPGGRELFKDVGRLVIDVEGEIKRDLGIRATPTGLGIGQDGKLLAVGMPEKAADVARLVAPGSTPEGRSILMSTN